MVFYRKYRSQTIAELDSPKLQETLRSILKGAVQNTDPSKPVKQADSLAAAQSVPHAFLFTGPKGLGKTSTARIIAKILNCTAKKRDGIEPCNECDQCVSITNGTNIDVLEIDGASNRGIDEIRELRERVNLAPSAAKKKVYIIDEVHMLTTEAFNALLKTIEEPPSHVVFIFATTEPQKVPATIISRCFHISLDRATDAELVHSLKRIVEKEKIDVTDDALLAIASMGDGGFRDTQKLFEEIIALSDGKKITKEMVEEKTHIQGVRSQVEMLLAALSKKDAKKSLEIIKQITDQGNDIKYVLFQTLVTLHDLLLKKMGVDIKKDVPENGFTVRDLQSLIFLFETAHKDSRYAVIASLPLELAAVMWCQSEDDQITESPISMTSTSSKPTLRDTVKKEQNLKVKQVLTGVKPAEKKKTPDAAQPDLPKDIQDNTILLENLIYKVKPFNHSLAGVLRSCVIQSISDSAIVFQTAYVFHKERIEDIKAREILEKAVKEITGKNLTVSVVLKEK